ncbi:MAG: neutral zinc metallopeptidase [Hyphomicrobiales bacterium]|nr:neutral zinc metallopeptidase [Hyphomicrobiales bacterium]
MRWRGRKKSENVEDRRGQSGRRGFGFPFPRGRGGMSGRGVRIPMPKGRGGGIGIVGLIVVVVIMLMLGVDPRVLLGGGGSSPSFSERTTSQPTEISAEDREKGDFVAVVLKDTEDYWTRKFAESGQAYQKPTLVLFRDSTRSGCGTGEAAMGPFYCPLDNKVYIDLSFYDDLKSRFRAPGDFAQAYVIAHEIGHHVQTLLGITQQVMQAKARASKREANAIQVRMELQADCYAGLWAHFAQRDLRVLDAGDIDEALTAAAAIGDDRIQKRTTGYIVPDAFTHGSSEQRVRWFRRGFESGNFDSCDTFSR